MNINDAKSIILSISAQRLLNETSAARRGIQFPDPREDLDSVRERVARRLSDMLEESDLRDEADIQQAARERPGFGETLFGLKAWLEVYQEYKWGTLLAGHQTDGSKARE